jgi:catechol 2,3-dioxygenase-like lactoylglutathione lyase family enzyme
LTIEINGMAHVILTVSDFDASRAFYCELLPFLGMKKVYDGNNFVYHVGGRTAVGIQRCATEHEGADVDRAAHKLREMGAYIDRGPMEREWADGYYFFVFEDPDGIRLEINHIPGKGLLTEGGRQNPSDDPNWDQNA